MDRLFHHACRTDCSCLPFYSRLHRERQADAVISFDEEAQARNAVSDEVDEYLSEGGKTAASDENSGSTDEHGATTNDSEANDASDADHSAALSTDNDGSINSGASAAGSEGSDSAEGNSTADASSSSSEITIPVRTDKTSDPLYQAALAYNNEIYDNKQAALSSLDVVESFPLDTRDYGFSDNVFGKISIPAMGVELAIYLGASDSNMANGACVFGQTSLPLGEDNENSSICGHRGWSGTPMFRDIQMVDIGDYVYITNPWEKLTYQVYDIVIVTPTDSSWCQIREGKTIITLMTCHPYEQNYQRYIVFAELAGRETLDAAAQESSETDSEAVSSKSESERSDVKEVRQVNADGTTETVLVDSTSIQPDGNEYGAVWSNFIILAEDKMRLIMYALSALVAAVFIYLIVKTVRSKGNKKKQ